jgi:hypothetical protein
MVERTLCRFCAGLASPLPTAAVSSFRRWGKYHSVPSTLFIPNPENILANRLIGVLRLD